MTPAKVTSEFGKKTKATKMTIHGLLHDCNVNIFIARTLLQTKDAKIKKTSKQTTEHDEKAEFSNYSR